MFNLNSDYKARDEILAPYYQERNYGGIQRFECLPASVLKDLVKQNFASLADSQNDSPSLQEMLDFVSKYPFAYVHGYAVSHERSDYRITVEGIEGKVPRGLSYEEESAFIEEFMNVFIDADERELRNDGSFRVWYD